MKLNVYRIAFTCALFFSFHAQAAIDLATPIPVDPHVKVGKLANGLTYYIRQNAKPEKQVELRLVVKAGSILEDDDQQGLAHFTEHMAFDGSRHFKKHELISYLQSIGVKFGADLNAYTSFDETVYMLPIPTTKKENLETGFTVLEDWAQGASMKDDAIALERPVVLEEARLGKGASDRMSRKLLPAYFNGSRYAERLPIGKEDILKTFKGDVIRRFYADWYRPDLEAVIVVGDIDPEQAERMIRAHFSGLKNPPHERPRNYTTIPGRTQSSGLIITDSEATDNSVLIRYPVQPKASDKTIADYRNDEIRSLYFSMLEQRLQELTQQANPPFLNAGSSISGVAPGYEAYSSFATLGRNGVAPAIAAVVQESERARRLGFGADELERAKKNTLRWYETAYNERDKNPSANHAAEYIRNFLVQETIPGIANEYAYTAELLPSISLDEVNRAAQQMTPVDAPKLVVYLGSSKENETTPTAEQLLSLVHSAEKAEVTAKAHTAVAASLMAHPPQGGSIVSEKVNDELGLRELTLSNGVKVILKPTDFQNDQVLMSSARFGGESHFSGEDVLSARYSNAIEATMGLDTFTPTDLPKILAGKAVSLQVNGDLFNDRVQGSSSSADIETMLQLLYLRMTSPRKDESLFHTYVSQHQDAAKNAMARPESVFQDAISTTLYGNNPRVARIAKPEDFNQINLDRAMSIFHQRFGSAKGMTFIIVGSFDVEKIKPLIATYLAALPTADVADGYQDLNIRPVSGVVKKDVYVGTEPKSDVTLHFTGPTTYSIEEVTRFNMLIDLVNIKLLDTLREKMSLIYSGGMSGGLERVPYTHYTISANLPCAPENVAKVIAATFAEIEKLKNDGPSLADVNKVKQNWIKNRQIAMRTNNLWIRNLQQAVQYGDDPDTILTYEKRFNAVTLQELKEAANRYFNLNNYVQVVQYPEKSVQAKSDTAAAQ